MTIKVVEIPEKQIMRELVILIGFPGSGKTTYGREKFPGHIRISLYELTNMVGGNKKLARKLEMKCIEKSLDMGFDVVVDRANLSGRRRKKLIKFAREKNARVTGIWFDVPEKIWQERNSKRAFIEDMSPRVPDYKIEEMKKQFEVPSMEDGYDELIIIGGFYE
jgi:predicted kinase